MNREDFAQLCRDKTVLLDGATGTNLMKAGMPAGVCPEQWILEHPDVILNLQRAYVEAGSDIIFAPTFTGNRIKLAEYGLENRLEEINTELVGLSRQAAGGRALVAGDLTMTGQQLEPVGKLPFETLVDVYKEQVRCLEKAGADLLIIETMMSLNECRSALIAARETCSLPVCVTLSFNEDGRTFYGTDPEAAIVTLQALGADAVGVNCSTGPEQMVPIVRKMRALAQVPVIAKPNAGIPEMIDGNTVYNIGPDEFAASMQALIDAGAGIVGGCCGTEPAHIRKLHALIDGRPATAVNRAHSSILSSERKIVRIGGDEPFAAVGERLNPTGKKKLQAAIRSEDFDYIGEMAVSQEQAGAAVLDVNAGMNGIDEKKMMKKIIEQVSQEVNLPLCIDSGDPDVIEAALRVYPGRALVNSVSLESGKIDRLLPIIRKYGAMFILLPVSDEGIPKNMEERRRNIRAILSRAEAEGFEKPDMIVDGLVATVGADKEAAVNTLDTISFCRDELHINTICGLSNISFGLPQRKYINAAFLTMAIGRGLTAAILNPSQDILMNAAFSAELLMHRKGADLRYIERMNDFAQAQQPEKHTAEVPSNEGDPVFDAVVKGNRKTITALLEKAVRGGADPSDLINEHMIPAITHVGDLFEKKIYFLPQLIASAQTMETGVQYLEPMLVRDNTENRGTVVIATVEGDVHDIGKNLVALMLRNYGYKVIDLGKNVSKEKIVETAVREKADIIALSALMTTTMMRMKDVIEYRDAQKVRSRVIIGGACITQEFADEIGADGYSKDAAEAVTLVGRLLGQN